jgi:chromosome segregation ATPase
MDWASFWMEYGGLLAAELVMLLVVGVAFIRMSSQNVVRDRAIELQQLGAFTANAEADRARADKLELQYTDIVRQVGVLEGQMIAGRAYADAELQRVKADNLTEREKIHTELEQTRQQLSDALRRESEARDRETAMQAEVKDLRERIALLEGKLSVMDQEVQKYRAEAESERGKREDAERKLAQVEAENDKLKQELEALKALKDKQDAD